MNSLIMPEDKIKRILRDIEEQGFPLEVRTSEFLEARGWEVTNQAGYTDYEEGKQRTVDIVAEKNLFLRPDEFTLDLWLIIECKQSNKPWVFYASDFDLNKPELERKAVSSMQFDVNTLAHQKKFNERLLMMINQFLIETHLNSPIFDKLALIPFEAFTGGQLKSIHKARMQVCNAVLDLEKRFGEAPAPSPYGIVLMPIIVLDGDLCTYKNKRLNPEEGVFYHFSYADSAFMIEIVTEGFLGTYLDTVEEQIRNFQAKHALA